MAHHRLSGHHAWLSHHHPLLHSHLLLPLCHHHRLLLLLSHHHSRILLHHRLRHSWLGHHGLDWCRTSHYLLSRSSGGGGTGMSAHHRRSHAHTHVHLHSLHLGTHHGLLSLDHHHVIGLSHLGLHHRVLSHHLLCGDWSILSLVSHRSCISLHGVHLHRLEWVLILNALQLLSQQVLLILVTSLVDFVVQQSLLTLLRGKRVLSVIVI